MSEIRRIKVAEAAPVAELWDRMCRGVRSGAVRWRRTIGAFTSLGFVADTVCLSLYGECADEC